MTADASTRIAIRLILLPPPIRAIGDALIPWGRSFGYYKKRGDSFSRECAANSSLAIVRREDLMRSQIHHGSHTSSIPMAELYGENIENKLSAKGCCAGHCSAERAQT
ncbi:MAG: hypothetical protein QE494_11230 [Ramlibacter sp.]|uniref:hypothetical protein n=1 Tax=Ramlibacter sp. TaxID=1917967 RepID=UPI00262BE366|nr:hypothetical protein [Ramlibacter sp.]MDH4376861.1 hypothetical protein [Ramlibacter sp.]